MAESEHGWRAGKRSEWYRSSAVIGRHLALVLLMLSGLIPALPAAADEGAGLRLVVVVVPGLGAGDLARPELPALQQILREGASGWMDCRGARPPGLHPLRPIERPSLAALFLTLGSGAPALAGDETAPLATPSYHELRVSPYPPPETLKALKVTNQSLGASVGALGDLFHRAKLHTAIMGNLDANLHDRSHYLLAMDSTGNVDYAGKPLLRKLLDETAPYGLRTDVPMLLTYYEEARPQAALRVIAFGDLYRAERYSALCLPEIAEHHHTAALTAFNAFLAALHERLVAEQSMASGQPVRLLLLSPGPATSSDGLADRFAPLVLWGSGIQPGSLTSATTHRAGLVSNTDLVATVADWLRLPPPAKTKGSVVTILPQPISSPEILAASHETLVREAELPEILGGLATFCTLCVLALVLIPARRLWPRLAAGLSIALVAFPLGLLLLPLLHLSNASAAGISLAVFVLLPVIFAGLTTARSAFPLFAILFSALLLTLVINYVTTNALLRYVWVTPQISSDLSRSIAAVVFLLLLCIWAGISLRTVVQKCSAHLEK